MPAPKGILASTSVVKLGAIPKRTTRCEELIAIEVRVRSKANVWAEGYAWTEMISSCKHLVPCYVGLGANRDARSEDRALAYYCSLAKDSASSNGRPLAHCSVGPKVIISPEVSICAEACALIKRIAFLKVRAFPEMTERTKVIVVAKDGITVEHLPSWEYLFASKTTRPIECLLPFSFRCGLIRKAA
jgi:hypothetical protein